MAIRIRIGDYERVTDDALGRHSVGYFPRMTESEAWEAGRGVWRLDLRMVRRERFALVVGEGRVRAIAEITDVTAHGTDRGGKKALWGTLLTAGHPLYDQYVGQIDPLNNDSRNSIAYGDLPEEVRLRARHCACGCGRLTRQNFVPGHALRAVQARISKHFGGSVLSFIAWLDHELPIEEQRADALTPDPARTR
ncbi:hypothetical protein AB0I22_29455 [Streptomyces sp. NPDC050610]|uniref:hypothetical protein n=1 Tax=Streptomyces sp. NPDC050610 TaxID=3157097 RepID=UPI00342914D7